MRLKFTPKISYYANLYFFIQNLSEWHFSNRKKYNEVWRKELSLPVEVDSYLKEFKKIHQKYSFGDKYLGRPFFLYDNPWSQLKLIVDEIDFIKVKEVFSTLEPYFKKLYVKDKIVLEKWEIIIKDSKFINKSFYLNKTLASFYGCPTYEENCTIYLLLSTKEKNGGTARTINDHSVTLELSRTSIELEKQALNILWHELIHLYFRSFRLYPLLKKYTNNNLEIMNKIDELIASVLLPNGLLKEDVSMTINKSKKSEIFNARIVSNDIIKIQRLIYPYLKENKTIDDKFVKEIYALIIKDKKRSRF